MVCFAFFLGFGGKSHGSVCQLVPLQLFFYFCFVFEIDNSQDTAYRTNLVRLFSMATPSHGFPSARIKLTHFSS